MLTILFSNLCDKEIVEYIKPQSALAQQSVFYPQMIKSHHKIKYLHCKLCKLNQAIKILLRFTALLICLRFVLTSSLWTAGNI